MVQLAPELLLEPLHLVGHALNVGLGANVVRERVHCVLEPCECRVRLDEHFRVVSVNLLAHGGLECGRFVLKRLDDRQELVLSTRGASAEEVSLLLAAYKERQLRSNKPRRTRFCLSCATLFAIVACVLVTLSWSECTASSRRVACADSMRCCHDVTAHAGRE